MKIKIALSKDEVRILIKILVRDHWACVFRGGKIDNLNAMYMQMDRADCNPSSL